MRIRKLVIAGALAAVPVGFLVTPPAEAASVRGPCKVTLGNPPPSVAAPTATVNPDTGEVYFKPGHIDTGNPAPRVECFGIILG